MEAVGSEVVFALSPLIIITILLIYSQRQLIHTWYNNMKVFIFGRQREEVPVNAGPVFHEGQCSICLSEKSFQISATCGHTYCAQCIFSIYQRNNEKLLCPLCRKPISTIFKLFNARDDVDSEEKTSIERKIRNYNQRFDDNRSLLRRIKQFPYVLRRATRYMGSLRFWLLFFRSLHFFRVIGMAIIYLLLPLDFIPERLFGFIGFLDDIFVFLFLILLGVALFLPIFIRYLGRG